MAWTIFARDPETGARGLVIEVRPELGAGDDAQATGETAEAVRALCRRLFDRNVRVGMLVTPSAIIVVRDRLTAMSFADNEYDQRAIATTRLFEAAGVGEPVPERLLEQVRAWLTVLIESWDSHLPVEAYAAFVPDVVGHLVRADIDVHAGELPLHSAAE